MKKPQSVATLEEFGRKKLSDTFFMRDFLYSEISQIEGIPNIPDDPDLAVKAGSNLCQLVLEPIQAKFGRIAIRSAFRAAKVNEEGAKNHNQYNCSQNEANFAGHIWDRRDANGQMGATACIVVPAFLPYYDRTHHWEALAWWIHDNISDYSDMEFYPKLAAFNISWHERAKKEIYIYARPKGWLTKPDMPNQTCTHEQEYAALLHEIATRQGLPASL